ncbi:hypothetical protein BDN70DRAFT_998053 [Pholiota conissans]|uniref:Uncharacterized protein n=1 Tax=Pholiota conissans TaxID=109636 RepID=A0A9P5YQ47_9AGAR|nr:hypothetical protein BDN70DRAFT_998053 [Pholiota conissans]
MIRLLDRYSDRWHKLKLNGPPALLDFFNKPDQDERELQQLRVLDLSIPTKLHNRNQTLYLSCGPHAAQLESLSIKGYMFVKFVNMNLNHLTQLTMVNVSLPTCLEAVRIIPGLVNCVFEGCSMGRLNNDFLLPRKPIKNKTVQRLQFIGDGALFGAISHHLMCSSLESLLVNNTNGECQNSAYSIISFLEKSRCSLECLSLVHVNLILDEEYKAVTSLCELMPTIRSFHPDFSGDFDSFPVHLFKVLSKFSIIDKRKVPQYLPLLSSLSLKSKIFYQWDSLLDIFGPHTPRSITRHRRALKHVTILVLDPHDRSVGERGNLAVAYNIDVPILKTILWLRDSAGVTWDVKSGSDEDEVIALAVRWYRGSGPVVRTAI